MLRRRHHTHSKSHPIILQEQPIGYQREAVVVGTGLFEVGGGADVSREPPKHRVDHLDDDHDNDDDDSIKVNRPEDRNLDLLFCLAGYLQGFKFTGLRINGFILIEDLAFATWFILIWHLFPQKDISI